MTVRYRNLVKGEDRKTVNYKIESEQGPLVA